MSDRCRWRELTSQLTISVAIGAKRSKRFRFVLLHFRTFVMFYKLEKNYPLWSIQSILRKYKTCSICYIFHSFAARNSLPACCASGPSGECLIARLRAPSRANPNASRAAPLIHCTSRESLRARPQERQNRVFRSVFIVIVQGRNC